MKATPGSHRRAVPAAESTWYAAVWPGRKQMREVGLSVGGGCYSRRKRPRIATFLFYYRVEVGQSIRTGGMKRRGTALKVLRASFRASPFFPWTATEIDLPSSCVPNIAKHNNVSPIFVHQV
ncbi:unnamed protein product [Ectocarpus sp. 12 AP-2014]